MRKIIILKYPSWRERLIRGSKKKREEKAEEKDVGGSQKE